MFRKMRRTKCELGKETAEKILREGIFGVLSLSGDNGYTYGVPINYAVEGKKIYFHSAKSGHKLDAIKNNSKFLSVLSISMKLLQKNLQAIFQV